MSYCKTYLKESLSKLDIFLGGWGQQLEVALTQALGDTVGLGQGWTWQWPQVGMSLLKGDDSVPTEG